jgi:hypothetical protein
VNAGADREHRVAALRLPYVRPLATFGMPSTWRANPSYGTTSEAVVI